MIFLQVTKGKQRIDFFTIPEYEQWVEETVDAKKWDAKYYKVRPSYPCVCLITKCSSMENIGSRDKQ